MPHAVCISSRAGSDDARPEAGDTDVQKGGPNSYCLTAVGIISIALLVADVMLTLQAAGMFWG